MSLFLPTVDRVGLGEPSPTLRPGAQRQLSLLDGEGHGENPTLFLVQFLATC